MAASAQRYTLAPHIPGGRDSEERLEVESGSRAASPPAGGDALRDRRTARRA
jgi:hypothetical protein